MKQIEVCTLLSEKNRQFQSIDTTTYSRWESGNVLPSPIKQVAMLDILDSVKSYDAIIPSINKAKAKVYDELMEKIFHNEGLKTYFSQSHFRVLKSIDEITSAFQDGRIYRHTHHVGDDYSWLLNKHSLEEMIDLFGLELIALYYDGILINHVLIATVPIELIARNVPNGDYFRALISQEFTMKNVNVISSSVVTDFDFMKLSFAYVCSRNFSDSKWLKSPMLSQTHNPLWKKLFNLYGSKSLPTFTKSGQPCNYQLFEPYSFMTNFLIEKTYSDNIGTIAKWI